MSKRSYRTQQGLRRMIQASDRMGLYDDEDFELDERLVSAKRRRQRHRPVEEHFDTDEFVTAPRSRRR